MTSPRDPRAAAALSRRSLLIAAGAGLTVSACTRPTPSDSPTTGIPPAPGTPESTSPTAKARSSAEPTTIEPSADVVATLEVPPPYVVLPGEVEPACKVAAVRFLEAVFTAPDRAQDEAGLAQRLALVAQQAPAAATLVELLPAGGPTALAVSYPQYGGLVLRDGVASMMVVADQLLIGEVGGPAPGATVRRTVVVDVRLSRVDGSWLVTDALPGRPAPAAPTVSPAVQAVLDDDRVLLPGTARADLLTGTVDDVVAAAMTTLAGQWRIGVHVLRSGHPEHVFATDRLSAHTIGRAVDIWSIDDVPVIDQGRSQWRALMEASVALGAGQVGGPADLGPPSAPSFTDHVHQDHVHVGWRTDDSAGAPVPPG